MSLFQRIRTPFGELADDDSGQLPTQAHAVGELLRERRRELGLELDDIGEALRIKPIFLAAIEEGRTEDLPGPTYASGFIRAFANYLGLDGDRVLDSYKAESADVQTRPDLSLPVPLAERSLPGGPILLVGLIIALCGYGTWYYLATGDRTRPERVAPVPAELQQLAAPLKSSAEATAAARAASGTASSTGVAGAPRFGSGLVQPQPDSPVPANTGGAASVPEPAAVPEGGASSPATAAPIVPGGPGNTASAPAANPSPAATGSIDIRALADCWIQLRAADQSIVLARVLKAGETYRVPRPGLILRTGNAGALSILVDGKPAPSLGAVGTLRRNVTLEPDALLRGTAVRG